MYKHGISVEEKSTQMQRSVVSDSAIQVVVGTAPVNLIKENTLNEPVILNNFEDAQTKMGYSEDTEKFSICEAIDVAFNIFKVSPIVAINVLNKDKHVQAVTSTPYQISNREVIIDEQGILLDSVVITSGESTYENEKDYILEFTATGKLKVTVLEEGTISSETTELSVAYTKLDPSLVTEDDILAGIEKIKNVYPKLNVVPGLLVVPGWSQKINVKKAMLRQTEKLNGLFNCSALLDIDTEVATTIEEAIKFKEDNMYIDKRAIVLWPMIKISGKKYYYSTVLASLIAYVDYINDNVPFVSPSNKKMNISGVCLNDGSEVIFDYEDANELNAVGIVTAVNLNGWRAWGNNTSIYPQSDDVKERFIPVRRMFDWWANSFILRYFERVDDPLNTKLIESIVDEENILANGFKSRFQIADAKIEFLPEDNSTADLLNGHIKFRQSLTPFPPAESIENVLEYDTSALSESIFGGEN